MNRETIYREISRQLQEGKPVVQATVVQVRGSTPRKEGSMMLVRQDGSLVGTIGGGCGEAGVIQKARLSLRDGRMREELADLTEDISLETEAVCGGTLRVFIQPWQPEQSALAERLRELAGSKREVWVHQVVSPLDDSPPALGKCLVRTQDGTVVFSSLPAGVEPPPDPAKRDHHLRQQGALEFYSERWEPRPTLVIIGAGHIAEPLDSFARQLDFQTVVVDDRSLFANRQRFPAATQVICGPILRVCQEIELSQQHYIVLVTRGHTLDLDALKVFTKRGKPLAYLGMIGSTRRVGAVFQLLEEEGYLPECFAHVHAPVGLNIAAETPAEIALSVLAEMVSIRRRAGQDTRSLCRIAGMHPSLRSIPTPAPQLGRAAP